MEGHNNDENQQQNITSTAVETTDAAAAIQLMTSSNPLAQEKIDTYMDGLRKEENLLMGLLLGFAAAMVGAVLWGVITVATGYQIGYMALGVGLMVGFAVRLGGKGLGQIFGIGGAVLALLGCVMGNLCSGIGFIAQEAQMTIPEVLALMDASIAFEWLKESASPMDILFYAIAVYEGYRFSFRQVTDEELAQAANA